MIASDIAPSGKASNDDGHIADTTEVKAALEAEKDGPINLVENEQSELDEYLDETAAEAEEDDELEEQSQVEAAAAANRK
jgi:hypothetical protein